MRGKSLSTKRKSNTLSWLAESSTRLGQDPLLASIKRRQIPLTRANYLAEAYPDGVPNPLPAELEAELPEQFRWKSP